MFESELNRDSKIQGAGQLTLSLGLYCSGRVEKGA